MRHGLPEAPQPSAAVHRRGPALRRTDLPAACLSSLPRRRGRPSGHRPRDRPGADGVPADLEHRPPAHRAGLLRLGRPRRGLHRGGPARDDGGGARLLPRATCGGSPRRGCAPLLARERAPRDPTRAWAGTSSSARSRSRSSAWRSRTRSRPRSARSSSSARAMIAVLFVMLRAEAVSRRDRELGEITRRDGLIIGFAQALALVPGVSRSGATISAGLFLNFDRTAAARYSFLLSVPGRRAVRAVRAAPRRRRRQPAAARPRSRPCWPSSSGTRRSPCCCATWCTTRSAIFAAYRMTLGLIVIVLAATNVIS